MSRYTALSLVASFICFLCLLIDNSEKPLKYNTDPYSILKKMMKAACLCVFFFLLILVNSEGRPIIPRPQLVIPSSSRSNTTQNQRGCPFTVTIRTSCRSSRYTRDRISLSFGDAYGNQVYAPTLDDPSSRAFERCSTDTYDITGPCTYDICYLYLYRSGRDGWRPADVTVSGYNIRPVIFHYDVWMPAGTWYGFNYCGRYATAATATTATAIAAMK